MVLSTHHEAAKNSNDGHVHPSAEAGWPLCLLDDDRSQGSEENNPGEVVDHGERMGARFNASHGGQGDLVIKTC